MLYVLPDVYECIYLKSVNQPTICLLFEELSEKNFISGWHEFRTCSDVNFSIPSINYKQVEFIIIIITASIAGVNEFNWKV